MRRRTPTRRLKDGLKDKERSQLAVRALVLFWGFFIVCGLLGVRLFLVQVRQGAGLAAYAGQEQFGRFPIAARRGDILDRFGDVFATSLPSASVFVYPKKVTSPAHEARQLASLLSLPVADIMATLHSASDRAYLARNVPRSVAARIEARDLDGVGIEDEPAGRRVDPQAQVGSTIIGFTGVDDQGLAGVEFQFDDVLRGRPGAVTQATDTQGRPIPFGRRTILPAQAGASVELTIDRSLQFAADDVLQATVERFHASAGSVVIMRAQTGEVLALANWPDFDPNHFWRYPETLRRNQAITDPYEPGSTFKLITAAAALDSGKVSLDDTFTARDEIEVGQRIIHNADDGLIASGRPAETIGDIIAFSHNVGAAQIALRVGKATMFKYIRRFGFDEPTGIDLPGESPGIVGRPDDWWGSRLATIGFGQGVSVTPLALARAYCAIANGGLLMRPLVVRSVIGSDGHMIARYSPSVVRRTMSPQTAAALLAMLRDVVRRGTAKGIDIPGFAIAGKTGTAQMVINGSYVPGAYTASFVGIVPADKPEYVVLVKIDRPQGYYYGSLVAAPAFRELARRVLWRENVTPKHVPADLADPAANTLTDAAGKHAAAARTRF